MTDELRVILEIGKQRKVVAGAIDWPVMDHAWEMEDRDLTG